MDGQVARLQDALLAGRQGELDLALELDDNVQADGPVQGAGRIGGRVDVPDRGPAAGRHEWGQVLQGVFVGFEVGVVGEQGRRLGLDVAEPHESAAQIVRNWQSGRERGGEEGFAIGVVIGNVAVGVWERSR